MRIDNPTIAQARAFVREDKGALYAMKMVYPKDSLAYPFFTLKGSVTLGFLVDSDVLAYIERF